MSDYKRTFRPVSEFYNIKLAPTECLALYLETDGQPFARVIDCNEPEQIKLAHGQEFRVSHSSSGPILETVVRSLQEDKKRGTS